MGKGGKVGGLQETINTLFPLCAREPEEAAEKINVLIYRKGCIEVLAKALRDVGYFGADFMAVDTRAHISVQDMDRACLYLFLAGYEAEQG